MAVSNDNRRDEYVQVSGVEDTFAYSFKITDDEHIAVYLDGVLQPGGYTVTGVGNETGTVEFAAVPAMGAVITFIRSEPLVQTTEYPVGSKFPAVAHEGALDTIVRQNQQQQEELDRSIRWPVNAGEVDNTLPDPTDTDNQGKALFISADGSELEVREIAETEIQSVLTTKGGLVTRTESANQQLSVGDSGASLQVEPTETTGIVWRYPAPYEFLDNRFMRIWQRGVAGAAPPDRYVLNNLTDGTVSILRTSAVVPTPVEAGIYIPYSLHLNVTGADAILSAAQTLSVHQAIEGYDAMALFYKTFVVSFWVRSASSGVYSFAITNNDSDYGIVREYTIAEENTWERKSILIPALNYATATGGWKLDHDTGFRFTWSFAGGSGGQDTLDVWQAMTGGAWSNNQVNGVADTDSHYLTGIQLDLGTKECPLRMQRLAEEFAQCQRYFCKSLPDTIAPGSANGSAVGTFRLTLTGTGVHSANVFFPVRMRTTPTVTAYSFADGEAAHWRNVTAGANIDATIANAGPCGASIVTTGSHTEGHILGCDWAASAVMV